MDKHGKKMQNKLEKENYFQLATFSMTITHCQSILYMHYIQQVKHITAGTLQN